MLQRWVTKAWPRLKHYGLLYSINSKKLDRLPYQVATSFLPSSYASYGMVPLLSFNLYYYFAQKQLKCPSSTIVSYVGETYALPILELRPEDI